MSLKHMQEGSNNMILCSNSLSGEPSSSHAVTLARVWTLLADNRQLMVKTFHTLFEDSGCVPVVQAPLGASAGELLCSLLGDFRGNYVSLSIWKGSVLSDWLHSFPSWEVAGFLLCSLHPLGWMHLPMMKIPSPWNHRLMPGCYLKEGFYFKEGINLKSNQAQEPDYNNFIY